MAYVFRRSRPRPTFYTAVTQTVDHWEDGPASHGGIEINFDPDRPLNSTVDGRALDLAPSQVVMFNAEADHTEHHSGSNLRNHAIVLKPSFLIDLFAVDTASEKLVPRPFFSSHPDLLRLAHQVVTLSHSAFVPEQIVSDLTAELTLSLFEATTLGALGHASGYYPQLIRRVRRYLFEHRSDPDLSLATLADQFRMSKYHLLRIFKRATGLTPMRYLKRLRLEHSAHQLATGFGTVTELALDNGFSNLSAFYEGFRATYGQCPSNFVNRVRSGPSPTDTKVYEYMAVEMPEAAPILAEANARRSASRPSRS